MWNALTVESVMLCVMSNPVLDTSPADPSGMTDEELDRGLGDYSDYITENGAFAQGDTLFATGHCIEDRDVWFDILTVTLDDIMRECAVPEEQREQRQLRYRVFAEHFLRHYDGPEKTVPLLDD